MELYLILALVSMVGFGMTAFIYKLASKSLDGFSITFFTLLVNVFVVGVIWFFWPNKQISWDGIKFTTIAGIIAGISSLAYVLSIKMGSLSISTTIRALFFVVTVLLAVFFLQESITITKVIGIGLAIVSIILLSI